MDSCSCTVYICSYYYYILCRMFHSVNSHKYTYILTNLYRQIPTVHLYRFSISCLYCHTVQLECVYVFLIYFLTNVLVGFFNLWMFPSNDYLILTHLLKEECLVLWHKDLLVSAVAVILEEQLLCLHLKQQCLTQPCGVEETWLCSLTDAFLSCHTGQNSSSGLVADIKVSKDNFEEAFKKVRPSVSKKVRNCKTLKHQL